MDQIKITTDFAVLDVKEGRHRLERHFAKGGGPIPITISGLVDGLNSRDDETWIGFSIDVTSFALSTVHGRETADVPAPTQRPQRPSEVDLLTKAQKLYLLKFSHVDGKRIGNPRPTWTFVDRMWKLGLVKVIEDPASSLRFPDKWKGEQLTVTGRAVRDTLLKDGLTASLSG